MMWKCERSATDNCERAPFWACDFKSDSLTRERARLGIVRTGYGNSYHASGPALLEAIGQGQYRYGRKISHCSPPAGIYGMKNLVSSTEIPADRRFLARLLARSDWTCGSSLRKTRKCGKPFARNGCDIYRHEIYRKRHLRFFFFLSSEDFLIFFRDIQ